MAADAAKNPLENEKYRQVIQEYYRENGLQRPQRIIDELQRRAFFVRFTASDSFRK